MVAMIAAGTSARYYLAQVEYYLGGCEPQGIGWLPVPGSVSRRGSRSSGRGRPMSY